jgi:uncharacterized membrane protein YhiD involved in acid resistance
MEELRIEQALRDLLGDPGAVSSTPGLVLRLGVAALMSLLVARAYIHFGKSLSNRRLFAGNFLLLTMTTTLVISIVKSSLALSLGLVGALSIVRFRAAIKEPEELAYLFLAIGIGLGLGAGQTLVTIVALIVIVGLIAIRSLFRKHAEGPNLFITVSSPGPMKLSASQILEALSVSGTRASLKRFDETPDLLEASFLVDFLDADKFQKFNQLLRHLQPGVTVRCVDDRGLVA